MKRFQFPLDRVREFRKLQMESEQSKMEQLYARLHSIESMSAELERQKKQAESSVVSAGSVAGLELDSLREFKAYARRMASLFQLRRVQIEAEIDLQKEALLEARRKYEVLDRLKGRARSKWQHEFDKEQDELAAEVYLAGWNRSQTSGSSL